MDTRDGIAHLCKWTRRIISRSRIQSLTLVYESDSYWDASSSQGPHVSFDSLAMHLMERHSSTLRALRMEHSFLGFAVVKQLCERCNQIEVLEISSTIETLREFPMFSRDMRELRSITLTIRHVKKQKLLRLFDDQKAREFFENGSPALRTLRVNSRQWEAKWSTVGPSKVQLIVEMVGSSKAPQITPA